MAQATTQDITNVIRLPRRTRKAKAKATRKPKPRDITETMRALYEWRDARREYDRQLAGIKSEERWGGLRSLALLAVISSVMVGMLVAGVMG